MEVKEGRGGQVLVVGGADFEVLESGGVVVSHDSYDSRS